MWPFLILPMLYVFITFNTFIFILNIVFGCSFFNIWKQGHLLFMTVPLVPNTFPASWQVLIFVGECLFHYTVESGGFREHVEYCITKCLIMWSKYSNGVELHAIFQGPNKLSSSSKSDQKLSWSSARRKNYNEKFEPI